MATITLKLPDELAERVQAFNRWLPSILEISLLTLKTPATRTASEIIEFLATNPSAAEVHAYHGTKRARRRMSHLLDLNRAGLISEAQLQELDELLKLEHLIINLKAGLPSDELASA
jgi:hypothetical protein